MKNSLPILKLNEEEWMQAYGQMKRLYHKGYGHSVVEILQKNLKMPDYILVRDDEWTLGCYKEEFDEAYKIWEKDWVHILAPAYNK